MAESYEVMSGRDRFFRLLEEESRLMLDPATGRLRSDWAEHLACPLCGEDDPRELFVKEGLRFVRCPSCRLVYMNPRLSAEALAEMYGFNSVANEAWVDVLLTEVEEDFQVRDFGALLDWIEVHGGGGRLLDVGCSVGRLLRIARDRGYEGVGVELGRRAARYARDAWRLDVREEPLEDAGFSDASFDVVTLVETLEHVPDPRAMLEEIHRVLRPEGLLLVGVPNVGSLGVLALGAEARTFNRNHLVYYDEVTLSRLLEECGFQVVGASSAVPLLDAVLNQLQGLDPFAAPEEEGLPTAFRRALSDPGWRASLENELCALGLGYRLRVVARRS